MSTTGVRSRARAQAIVGRSGSRVAELDKSPLAHRVILRLIPRAVPRRFDPEAARDLRAVFELRIRDPRGGEPTPFQLTIADGLCQVNPGPAPDPDATAALGADDMIRLVSGAIGFPELLASSRLELGGDPFLALRFPGLFRLPPQAGPQ
jgi:hypothetical protein